ncbi:(4Fe-4S)-binding protein [Peptostreptococcus faecalis]|uniref:(4Fe-4S)-binding protein n=1 Tax=Peptostreptococcus faecalis TaxID=2045015 RepID=UPI000C7D9333|nr:(4Fe-4S)-binding protein [Peptostreptococcus faecalis]
MKEYKVDNLTIIWQPEKCTHAGVCSATLPNVYFPKERPWIRPENATVEELKNQINLCPSGALSFRED